MVVTCTIGFHKNSFGTYFAGETVSGKIILSADEPKQVRGVAVKINGFAHVSWEDGNNWHTGIEKYLSSVTYVMSSSGNGTCTIEPGVYTYEFSCDLPVTCPSSFEGACGHIRYQVKVALVRPWKFDQTFTQGFTVLNVMDLNSDSQLLKSAQQSRKTTVEKSFCCGPCKSDPLTLEASLPRTGFVPGQSIPVDVMVCNESRVPVEDINVVLFMYVVYCEDFGVDVENQRIEVSKLLGGEKVLRHSTKRFNYNLSIPATPPTCLKLCRIIQITYKLEVIAIVKGAHLNPTLSVPVTIGIVPLREGVIQQQPVASGNEEREYMAAVQKESSGAHNALTREDLPSSSLNSTNAWIADANINPPTYEEALHVLHGKINADEAHDYGPSEFTPLYAVFTLPSSSTAACTDDFNSTKVKDLGEGL